MRENIEAKKDFQEQVQKFFPRLCCPQWDLPLSILFPPSKNKKLERFRLAGSHADLAFYLKDKECENCKDKPICKKKGQSHVFAIFEPGGFQHAEKDTAVRDQKKFLLCKENNTGYGGIRNFTWSSASRKTLRNWVGKILYERFNEKRRVD
jgi:hypothetical protein